MERTLDSRLLTAVVLGLLAGNATAQETIDTAPSELPDEQLVPVAEDEAATVPEPGERQLTEEEELAEQFERFKMLLGDDVLDEADSVAKRVVELAIRVAGPRSNETAKALTNLAIVQHRTEQYDAAQQNFEAAVDIIEENEDRLNAQLVNPLKGLGASQLAGGRPDLASQTYNRAIHVTHVNDGPHNLEQVDLLESLANVNLSLGALEEARELQNQIYALNIRHFDGNLVELVPMLLRRASWQRRAGFIFDERTTYRRIIKIIEDDAGKDDVRLIEPLTRLGQSYYFVDLSGAESYQPATVTSGEIYFKRAVRIAEESPDSDWRRQSETTLDLGDFYMVQGNEQRARAIYRDVWKFLSEEEERLDFRREALEQLTLLRQRSLPQFVDQSGTGARPTGNEELQQGKITVTYKVSSRGRVDDLKIVEATPPEFTDMLTSTQREIRRRVFRPVFIEGDPVTSDVQVLTHRFYYRPADLEALRDASSGEEVPEATAAASES